MSRKNNVCYLSLKAAFPYTLPIFAGFWFLGMAYGMYMNVAGFSFWYADEFLYFWRIFGICRCNHADKFVCAFAGAHHDPSYTGSTSILWNFYAGTFQGFGMEAVLSDIWPLR